MKNCCKVLFFIGVFAVSTSFGDVISGMVTDLDSKTGVAGVKVSIFKSTLFTTTGSDGSYLLNTSPTAIGTVAGNSRISNTIWDDAKRAFRWDATLGKVSIDVFSMAGRLIDRYDGRSSSGFRPHISGGIALAVVKSGLGSITYTIVAIKDQPVTAVVPVAPSGATFVLAGDKFASSGTMRYVWFEKDSYVQQIMDVQGSNSGVNVAMKKFDIAAKTWRTASLTWYTSWPEPGSQEWEEYSGGNYCGMFAGVSDQKPETWVAAHNIVAVHSKDFSTMKLRTLRLRMSSRQIDAQVLDYCADSDCDGCCTRNAGSTGYLIDIESYTKARFGTGDGTAEWTCLDCN